jgi:TonB family protein
MLASNATSLIRQRVALSVLCGLTVSAWAAGERPLSSAREIQLPVVAEASSQPLDFNIPAQSLAAALNQYGAISDQPAVFASDLVIGRTSSTVQGKYSAEAGLRLLLQGSGLSFEKITSELGTTFLLTETGKPATHATLAAFYGLTGYPGLIQARIQEILCADPLTMPGQYNTLFRFQLDGDGNVRNVILLDSTGSARRDDALLKALQRGSVNLSPPPMVVGQPLTMHLRRSDQDAGSQCTPAPGQQRESRQ